MIYIGWLKRFFAYMLDVGGIYFIVYVTLSILQVRQDFFPWMLVSARLLAIPYFTFFPLVSNGQTLGQKVLAVRTLSDNGARINFKQGFLRATVPVVAIAPTGLFLIITVLYLIQTVHLGNRSPYKEKRQTAWDIYSKTIAVAV